MGSENRRGLKSLYTGSEEGREQEGKGYDEIQSEKKSPVSAGRYLEAQKAGLPAFVLLGIGIPVASCRAARKYSVVERLRVE